MGHLALLCCNHNPHIDTGKVILVNHLLNNCPATVVICTAKNEVAFQQPPRCLFFQNAAHNGIDLAILAYAGNVLGSNVNFHFVDLIMGSSHKPIQICFISTIKIN
jgi:hypothetical protein